MNRQRIELSGLWTAWLLVVGVVLNSPPFVGKTAADETAAGESTEQQQAVTVELNVEAPPKRSSTLGGTSKFLELILSSRNKAADKAEDQVEDVEPADQSQALQATHQQVALLKVTPAEPGDQVGAGKGNGKGKAAPWGVKSFCLDREDNLLVAVGDASTGQLQLLNSQGECQQSWDLPIVPEALNVDSEGNYLVAGAGKIYKLDTGGKVLLEGGSPLVAHLNENRAEIRQQVIQQIQARAKSRVQQRDRYQQRLDALVAGAARRLDRDEHAEFLMLQKRIAKLPAADADKLSVEEQNAWALRKVLFRMLTAKVEKQFTQQEIRVRDIYRRQMKQFDEYAKVPHDAEPSDKQIEESLTQMIAYKSRIASISAVDNEVFIATGSAQGYGYDVWRFDEYLENPEKIISHLRGCCGQMDVQACAAGLFVAENSRHQVRHFDRAGKKVNEWGGRAREGVHGFGSCCNPMNVAFGPDGTIYTAESNSGRIKRYSPEGQLMELVGSVELVPGCKKVSIAVSQDQQRIYMLDITRNHVIVMEAKPAEQQVVSQEGPEDAS